MDKYDIPFLLKNLKNKMPLHSETLVKIPHNYGMKFPKNLKDQSDLIHNKVLNSYLSEIEEADYKKLLSVSFKKWFSNQNKKYHSSEIFNHDNLKNKLKNLIPPDHVLGCGLIINPFRFVHIPVDGDDLETGTAAGHGNFGDTQIVCSLAQGGVIGNLYDQIALNINSAMNNQLGVYDDDGSPNNLIAGDITQAVSTSYAWYSLTEFSLTTTGNWLCFRAFTNNQTGFFSGQTNRLAYQVQSYGVAFPDPSSAFLSGVDCCAMKIGHS